MKILGSAVAAAWAVLATTGCAPGYMKASELEARGQGPGACAKTCEDINMRMAALVLVSDQLPGCVCQPLNVQGAPALPLAPTPAPAESSSSLDGAASASTTGYIVLAAAAAARQQQRQKQQAPGSYSKKY